MAVGALSELCSSVDPVNNEGRPNQDAKHQSSPYLKGVSLSRLGRDQQSRLAIQWTILGSLGQETDPSPLFEDAPLK